MGLFAPSSKRGEPVFVKSTTNTELSLQHMRTLLPVVHPDDRSRLEQDIKMTEAGLYGENRVAFELRNSHLPIHVLRDLRLEHDGLMAQIDFLVIAPHINLLIECKNLIGDIEVNERGDFIRVLDVNGQRKRQGIYSPITQSQRHVQLIRSIQDDKGSFVRIANKLHFDDIYKTAVVLANPKSLLDDAHAPASVRKQIVRADALVGHLKQLEREGRHNSTLNEHDRMQVAERWQQRHVEQPPDIASRYRLTVDPAQIMRLEDGRIVIVPRCPVCGALMVQRTAQRGVRAGKPFWGCSTFPSCNGIINIGD